MRLFLTWSNFKKIFLTKFIRNKLKKEFKEKYCEQQFILIESMLKIQNHSHPLIW